MSFQNEECYYAHLKLAESIHNHPSLTTHRPSNVDASVLVGVGDPILVGHRTVRSGKRYPLSLANCSKHKGRNIPSEHTANTSLRGSESR